MHVRFKTFLHFELIILIRRFFASNVSYVTEIMNKQDEKNTDHQNT